MSRWLDFLCNEHDSNDSSPLIFCFPTNVTSYVKLVGILDSEFFIYRPTRDILTTRAKTKFGESFVSGLDGVVCAVSVRKPATNMTCATNMTVTTLCPLTFFSTNMTSYATLVGIFGSEFFFYRPTCGELARVWFSAWMVLYALFP